MVSQGDRVYKMRIVKYYPCRQGWAVVVLRRPHTGKAGIAGSFLGEGAGKACLVFGRSICVSAFFLFFVQLSLWDGAHCSPRDWQGASSCEPPEKIRLFVQ